MKLTRSNLKHLAFEKTFEESLRAENLIRPGDKIFVACSGGPDSVALVALLVSLKKAWNLRLGILHFNHRLRGISSDRDERFVKELAGKYGLPFYSGTFPVSKLRQRQKLSLEEAARQARYAFFLRMARRYTIDKIALAHNRDDQAETILMRIIQGTGLKGLCGIRDEMTMNQVTFVRPLLRFSKKEILDYLRCRRIRFRQDRSNQSLRFLRNRIRLELIPMLVKKFNPRTVDALARIPQILKDENEFLADQAGKAWKGCIVRRSRSSISFWRRRFQKLAPAIRFRLLNTALNQMDPACGMLFESWKNLETSFAKARHRASFPKGVEIVLTPDRVNLYKGKIRP